MRFPGKSAPAATASAGSSISESRSRLSFGVLATTLVCAAAFLGIGAPAASAAPEAGPGWSYRDSFGNLSSEVYDAVRNPIGVDGNGNVVAVEESQINFKVFAPDGELLTTYSPPGTYPRNAAVDPGNGTVYVDGLSPFGFNMILRYTSDGQATPTYTQDTGFEIPQREGMAVDPTSHDLLVADPGAEGVRRYDTSGTLVGTIATPGINPAWIVMAPDGSFFVAPADGPDVTHFSAAGTQLGVVTGIGALHGLAFDSARSLLVAAVGDAIKTYTLSGALQTEVTTPSPESIGLMFDPGSGILYEHGRSTINAYVPATIPDVETPVVSDIATDSAHVSAEVDPGAGPPEGSAARFEYSEDGGQSWIPTPYEAVERTGSDGPDTIEADLEGLTLNWDFLVRVKAINSLGSKTSTDVPFSTPGVAPLVTTGVASDRSEMGAVLHGTINPAGMLTTYHFEYGTTTAYGSRVPLATESPAGNLRTPRSVSIAIAGLQPGTTYHYRLVASNAIGETAGADMTFTTITAAEAFPQRVYEQVTPVDKNGAQIASEFHTQIDPAGSWIAVASASGSTEDEGVFMRPNYLVRRGAEDWDDWIPTEAPQNAASLLLESGTTGISADGNHALVISNRVLAPGGAFAGGGNLYDKDLRTGSYTFVGGASGETAYAELANGIVNESVFAAAAPDFSWILFWSGPALLPEANGFQLYRWTRTDGLSIESRIPDPLDPGTEIVSAFSQLPTQAMLTLPTATPDGEVVAFGAQGSVYRRANGVTKLVSVSRIPGDPSTPQAGTFDGMSSDGRYVFFHTNVHLVEDMPPNLFGEEAMYRYDALTDELIFLMATQGFNPESTLGISTNGDTAYARNNQGILVWRDGEVHALAPGFTGAKYFYVTENGRYLAWKEGAEAHLYDAEVDQDVCVSCPTDGTEGKGGNFLSLPVRYIGNTLPRAITEDGEMFFDTAAPLVAADRNGRRDVYAYRDGRFDLISPGDQNFEATFVGISDDGRDVYFQTDQGLVGRDVDGNTDVYDARVGGGFAAQNPPPLPAPCVRGGCEETSGGPVASPPVSSQKVAANKGRPAKKCRKGYVKKTVKGKRRCVKKPKAKKKAPTRQAGQSRTRGK